MDSNENAASAATLGVLGQKFSPYVQDIKLRGNFCGPDILANESVTLMRGLTTIF